MPLARLALTDFRSYQDALIEPGPGLVILTGDNGAGKTNLLEAVSLLTPGRGLRGASLAEMARQGGAGGFAVAAHLALPLDGGGLGGGGISTRSAASYAHPTPIPSPSRGGEEVQLGTGTTAQAPERRQVRINGAPASATALSEWLSVLWLTPAMDRLFTDSAGGRRRFLDRLVLALEPAHAMHSTRYEAAMRARNKLLAEERWDETWLDSLEAQMEEHGREISRARMQAVISLLEAMWTDGREDFPRSRLSISNVTPVPLQARLRASRKVHAAAGRATHGPNNEDLLVQYASKDMPAAFCSTGEQKALLIGLILAHADLVAERTGKRPILLLDEVAAHLDPRRRAALFERLAGAGGQVWMTGTEPALFEGSGAATRFGVAGGAVSRW